MRTVQSHIVRHMADVETMTSIWCFVYASGIITAYIFVLKVVF